MTVAIDRTGISVVGVCVQRLNRRAATSVAGGLTAQAHDHELSIEIGC